MNIREVKFVFFGTRGLGAKVLERLLSSGYSPTLVVTGPDKPVGRKQLLTASPVKVMAKKLGIPLFQPEKIQDTIYKIQDTKPDLIVLAAYGRIIPREILDIPRYGALNVHPSLLPLYRGPSPERAALLNGDEKTGVTVILMDEQIDHGPILAQQEFVIPADMRHEELHVKLGEIGGDLLVKTIPLWLEGKVTPKEQDHSKATYTKKLTKEDGRIDWEKSARHIEKQIRAFTPWPGTFALFGGKNLKILKALVLPGNLPKPGLGQGPKPGLGRVTPGTVFLTADKKLAVYAGKDALLIEELQLAGGKPMSSREFLLGHKEIINAQLL